MEKAGVWVVDWFPLSAFKLGVRHVIHSKGKHHSIFTRTRFPTTVTERKSYFCQPKTSMWEPLPALKAFGVFLHVCVLNRFTVVHVFVTLWIVAHSGPLSMGFSRQEYWSGLPCPPPGDHLSVGIKDVSPVFLHCRWVLDRWATGKASVCSYLSSKSFLISDSSFWVESYLIRLLHNNGKRKGMISR